MIDHFFQLEWRRLRDTYSEKSVSRHEDRLLRALYNRRLNQRAFSQYDDNAA